MNMRPFPEVQPIFSGTKCSCRCPFYMDGPVHNWCTKYNDIPRYPDSTPPPTRVEKCFNDFSNKIVPL